MIKELAVSMRPRQWYKNLLIFIAIIFSLNLEDHDMWIDSVFAFGIFCLLASSGYLINDVLDIQRDQSHPKKCNRPIASGRLKPLHVVIIAVALIAISLTGAYMITRDFFLISFTYICLSFSYSLFLKHLPILDVLTISTGFMIRAAAGGFAISIEPSNWLVICTFLLALYLSLGKRRQELVLLGTEAPHCRKSLAYYSIQTLDLALYVITGILIITYGIYTFLAPTATNYLALTIPLATAGLLRHLYLLHCNTPKVSEEVEIIFTDKIMMTCLIFWAGIAFIALYTC